MFYNFTAGGAKPMGFQFVAAMAVILLGTYSCAFAVGVPGGAEHAEAELMDEGVGENSFV